LGQEVLNFDERLKAKNKFAKKRKGLTVVVVANFFVKFGSQTAKHRIFHDVGICTSFIRVSTRLFLEEGVVRSGQNGAFMSGQLDPVL
jgi:hypothetical protein